MPKVVTDKEKIERLTKALKDQKEESKKEISKLKKDRRSLKSKVRYLSGKQSSNVNVSSSDMVTLQRENQTLKEVVEKVNANLKSIAYEAHINSRRAKGLECDLEASEKRYNELLSKTAKDLAECLHYSPTYNDRINSERFNNGEMTDNEGFYFFRPGTLLIEINPKNGRPLRQVDYMVISEKFEHNIRYIEAIRNYKAYRANNPNLTDDELHRYIHQKGMELLPLYKDYII